MRRLLFIIFNLLFVSASLAQPSPIGRWKTVDNATGIGKGGVHITQANSLFFGVVDQIFEPNKRSGKYDKCSDERRGKPVLGMTILRNVKASDNVQIWDGGDILDPENGKVYRVRLKLLEAGKKMEVRGYMGPFYRNQQWNRIE